MLSSSKPKKARCRLGGQLRQPPAVLPRGAAPMALRHALPGPSHHCRLSREGCGPLPTGHQAQPESSRGHGEPGQTLQVPGREQHGRRVVQTVQCLCFTSQFPCPQLPTNSDSHNPSHHCQSGLYRCSLPKNHAGVYTAS
jgi:hypothetical protein